MTGEKARIKQSEIQAVKVRIVVMLGEFGYSEAKQSREEGMVVLAVEVREVRRIELDRSKLSAVSGSAWLVHSLQPRSQVRFREKSQALRQDRRTLKTCISSIHSFPSSYFSPSEARL
jgi:hypothetical protein